MTPEELRAIRLRLNISQAELARRAGVNENTVARQERGDLAVRPSLERLYTVLDVYGDQVVRLFGLEPKQRSRGPRRGSGRRRKRVETVNVATFADRWLELMKDEEQPRTIQRHRRALKHIVPALGIIRLQNLSRDRIRTFLLEKRDAGLIESLKSIHGTLRAMLNAAVEDGTIAVNPLARNEPEGPQ